MLSIAVYTTYTQPFTHKTAHSMANVNKNNTAKTEPILSNAKSGLYGIWMFTLFWNAVSLPVLFAGRGELIRHFEGGDWMPLLALLFPLVGIVALALAVGKTFEWRRFGITPLFLDPYPGSIGGQVGGYIRLPEGVPTHSRYDVSLVCVYTYETRSADNKHRSAERMIWQNSQVGNLRRGMSGMDLRFCFDVPEGLPRSEKSSSNYHHWRLHVHAEMEGVDLDRSFDIPVHPTNEQTSLKVTQDHRKNTNDRLEQLSELMKVEVLPGLLHLRFPSGRRKLLGAALTFFGLLFGAVGFFLLRQGAVDDGGFMLTFMGLIFALTGLPIVSLGIYTPCNTLDVQVAKDAIAVRRSFLGIGLYRKRWAISQIQKLMVKEGARVQSGGKHTAYFKVVAVGVNGDNMVLAEGLNGQPLAEEALRFIRANGNLVV